MNRNHAPSPEELAGFERDIKAQYALEKWWVEDARGRDVEYNNMLRESGRVTTDRGVRALLGKLSERLAIEIEDRIYQPPQRGQSQHGLILRQLCQSFAPYELAYLVLAHTTNAIMSANCGYITGAKMIGVLAEAVETELRLRAMLELEPKLPRLVDSILKDSRASVKHRRRVFVNQFHKRTGLKIPRVFEDNHSRLEVGAALAELLLTPAGVTVTEIVKTYDPKKRDLRWVYKPSQQLREVFYRELDLTWLARRTTPFGILLYPPNKRVEGEIEMLLTKDTDPIRLNQLAGKSKAFLDTAKEQDYGYTSLLEVLSYFEKTPLKVNSRMLEWVLAHKEELGRAGILAQAVRNLPDGAGVDLEKPREQMTQEELQKIQEYKAHREKVENKFWKDRMAVIKQNRVLELAEKLSEYPSFYQRWYADFRGRLYPLNSFLSFQSSSLAKSLLEFAEPVSIKVGDPNDAGWCEFVEYGLRLMGNHSKAPAETISRIVGSRAYLANLQKDQQLYEGNIDYVLATVGKKNYFPYIAWVLELKRLLSMWGEQAESGHPIRKDATCSSMQHMAALAGDKGVLRATNCDSSIDTPQDLYTSIVPDYKEQGLERDWLKKFIMTYAYNSTDDTRKDEIAEAFEDTYGIEVKRIKAKDKVVVVDERILEINQKLKEAANRGLGKVVTFQRLLMEVYRHIVCIRKLGALSVTPTGMVVDSTKYDWPSKRYTLHSLQAKFRLKMKDLDCGEGKVNKRRTRQAWVANVIHSMDAALIHITATCLTNLENINVYMSSIHDCAVTRPGEMRHVMRCLGFAFKYMYAPNPHTGIAESLHQMLEFWELAKENPELYQQFLQLKAVHPKQFDDMRYFFI